MLLINGMLILNKAIFLHSHKMDNGMVIFHSHPYNKSNDTQPFKSHLHSDAELVFLENLKVVYPVLIMYLILLIPLTGIRYYDLRITKPEIVRADNPDYKAPPFL